MPRFTVLLPTHNRADVISYSIRSILAQTERDFELLVVGDGCTDATADVVAAFKDPRIHWFDFEKAPHSGYANRNAALRQANGELIAYAQHDDLMLPDHLALFADAMGDDVDWAYSRPLWVTTDGIIVPFGTNLTMPGELRHFLEVRNTIPSNCVVHRRDCLDRFGYWREDTAEVADWMLWKTMIGGVGPQRIVYVTTPTALHFSALWKNSRHSTMPEVSHWLAIIEETGWWPPALRRFVPGPRQEQAVWFEALEEGGEEFVAELRASVALVMDRQGWDSLLHTVPRIADLEAALAGSDAAIAQHRLAVAAANATATCLETQLQTEFSHHSAAMEAANARTASLETQLQTEFSHHSAAMEAANARTASLETQLQTEFSHHSAAMEAANARTASLEAQLRDAHERMIETERALAETQARLRQTTQRLDAILGSRSWRVMEPARRLRGFLRDRLGP